MHTQEKEPPTTLDPRRFTTTIRQRPEFLAELPTSIRFAELPDEQKRSHLQRAIAGSALSIAHDIEQDRGEYDLDANLYKLVGELPTFYESQHTINSLVDQYDDYTKMPKEKKQDFNRSKDEQTYFNHTLREVINTGASRFNFTELLTFMTNMHIASGGRETAKEFHSFAQDILVGMRNEMAFEQVLIASDLNYEVGNIEQDIEGGDFIIEGIPFDVKASKETTRTKQQKAIRNHHNPRLIIWSHINFEDYEGRLTLPYKRVQPLVAKVMPDIQRGLDSERITRAV